ncbi:MAG: sigma-54-dependent Fis family transcriptional regulator [Deltaproteobacteria bacterium]|nr:sigma-54-dependent Fis family transcriptional regulator [Deltaproteobacteria bacterium]
MGHAHALITTQDRRARVHRVDERPSDVPWAGGVSARSLSDGVILTGGVGPDPASRTLAPGRAALMGGRPTSCHEMALTRNGAAVLGLAGVMEAASEAMARVFHRVALYAPGQDPVLLLGESGTGKELVAQAFHLLRAGPGNPFLAVNVAAIPAELAEAELFGWTRGAFTGASDSRPGAFEAAGEGTLFLDEIGDASPGVQAKLLRALESGTFRRVGSTRPVRVKARIVAATNHDPGPAVDQGRFRLDLLQRLACLVLDLPPLRQRKEDIPVVTDRFCRDLPGQPEIHPDALTVLENHDWPGNVRELRNVIHRAALLTMQGTLTGEAVEESLSTAPHPAAEETSRMDPARLPIRAPRRHQIALSGLPRSTFYYRLKKGLIDPPRWPQAAGDGP